MMRFHKWGEIPRSLAAGLFIHPEGKARRVVHKQSPDDKRPELTDKDIISAIKKTP